MQRVITNNYRIRPNGQAGQNGSSNDTTNKHWNKFRFNELRFKKNIVIGFKTKFLAIAIFLFHFIEAGTVNLVPEKSLLIYRNVRISDLILYCLVAYSLYCYKEYKDLFKSRAFFLPKLFLIYLLIEFVISFLRYGFNPIEYFFRLKTVWYSFLIFPYMLLLKRNGFRFLIKIIFPVALISNFLYILTALTGIAFLSGVTIVKAQLPGDIEIYRVFGGTFFGDFLFLGFIYYWITNKFKLWQLFPTILFMIPHILAFGRLAWAFFLFVIVSMIAINTLRKKNFKIIFKQAFIVMFLLGSIVLSSYLFIPESSFYIDAIKARLTQWQDDVEYDEGTYGTRVISQNDALIKLWKNSDVMLGVGMHPMWVIKPESREELLYYSGFCDVSWPSVLAAYGLIGLSLAVMIQFYFIFISIKVLKKIPQDSITSFFITMFFAKLVFDATFGFSYIFTSTSLAGLAAITYYIPFLICGYEYIKHQNTEYSTLLIGEKI